MSATARSRFRGSSPGSTRRTAASRRSPWRELVEPALALAARASSATSRARSCTASSAAILLRDEGGRRVYGDPARVVTDDLCATLERVRDVGAAARRRAAPRVRGRPRGLRGPRTRAARDRGARAPGLRRSAAFARRPHRRRDSRALAARRRPVARGRGAQRSARIRSSALGPLTGTTHISVVDAAGTAAALSSTLGSGSGVFRGGTQMNNMLGELDVIGTRAARGRGRGCRRCSRRRSCWRTAAPGSCSAAPARCASPARSRRSRGARSGTRLPVGEAIDAPRLHVEGSQLHLEGGWGEETARARRRVGGRSLVGPQPLLRRCAGGRAATGRLARSGGRPAPWRRGTWSSRDPRAPRRARRRDRSRAARGGVGSEEGRWILATEGWRSIGDERRYLKTVHRHPDAAVFVAEDDGARCRAALPVARPASGEPSRRRRRPDGRRGNRRRGIGTSLLAEAVAWARRSGISKLELHVFPWNEPALRLYESFGFEREGYRKQHYARDDGFVDAILMAYLIEPDRG